ncbi:cell wall hydrolase [Metabacillus litoralis]|uniref:Cell wall hydrolase n=1 Tax=Metabacillus litoralis TaxID=152268 RepID=A0A5C6WAR7_9BACI|nr:cell wall hydrolase [Metabacillus litoralis]TXC92979.1 cell wall hydrolase [Metabacillus litoralis]
MKNLNKTITIILSMLMIAFYTISPTLQINAKTAKSFETGDTVALSIEHYGNYKVGQNSIELSLGNKEAVDFRAALNKTDQALSISKEEKALLARLVHAEAKGEPYVGKVAVANVVINRVEHEQFPDTVREVIYQKNAFQPVQNESIDEAADDEAENAVTEALALNKSEDKSLYFYNPDTATDEWIRTRDVTKVIGNHVFAI